MTSKFDRLVKSMPSLYRAEVNTMIKGLLQAWGLGDDNVQAETFNAKDQIYVNKAGQRYLDYLGANVGVQREPKLGADDNTFRGLVPVLSFYPKQVRKTLISLLSIFWGPGFTRPNITNNTVEPYNFGPTTATTGTCNFSNGAKEVKGNGTLFTIELNVGDYIKPTSSSSKSFAKVAAIIDNENLILSLPWSDPVVINTSIVKAPIMELEYEVDQRDRRYIRFKPNAFNNVLSITAQELADYINSDPEHNKSITGSIYFDPLAGNRFNIRTNTPGLLGSIQILGGSANSILNFNLDLKTETKASIYEVNPNEIIVKIPSSVPILRRSLKGSAHPRTTKAEIFSVQEPFNFATIGANSFLNVEVDGNPYTVYFDHAVDFVDPIRVTAEEVSREINKQLISLISFTNSPDGYGKVGLRTTEGSVEYRITGGTANSALQFSTILQQDPDFIQENYPSAYVFDPVGQLFTVTEVNSEITDKIEQGSLRPTIRITDASNFPNKPGKILLNFGRSEQEGPIDYHSRPNNTTLLIDASHIFQKEHNIGRKVNYVVSGPTIPRVTGDDYPVYVVGTQESREAAQELIKSLIAAGVIIRFVIEFPEFYFVCTVCANTLSTDYRGSRTALPPLVF